MQLVSTAIIFTATATIINEDFPQNNLLKLEIRNINISLSSCTVLVMTEFGHSKKKMFYYVIQISQSAYRKPEHPTDTQMQKYTTGFDLRTLETGTKGRNGTT